LCRALDGIARHKGHAAGRSGTTRTGDIGVVAAKVDLRGGKVERFGGDLNKDGMRALPEIGPSATDYSALNLFCAMKLNPNSSRFGCAEAVADILEAASDPPAAYNASLGHLARGVERIA